MNFVEQNWKWLLGIGIFILILVVMDLRSDNERLKEEAKQGEFNRQLTDNVYKQCLKEQPDSKHYLCTQIREVIEDTHFKND